MNQQKFGIATKAWIIKNNKILIIYKTANEAINDPNPWIRIDHPGGRVEFGENPQKALIREIREEVSLKVKVISPFDVWHFVKDNFQLIGIDYVCQWIEGSVHLSNEHENYEWLTLEEIKTRQWKEIEKYEKVFDIYKKLGS